MLHEKDVATLTYVVSGLEASVEILIDRWGVPHIYGQSARDVFMSQGFVVARDRLWQIDTWRKRGLGLLSAEYGGAFVEADAAARLLLFRGDIDEEWACYGPEARQAAEAFTAGINAYVAYIEGDPSRLPVEFERTGARPSRWEAEDCVRIRSHSPLFNFGRELARAQVVARFGLEGEAVRRRLEPEWTLKLPEGIAAEEIPPEVARTFALATNMVDFSAADIEDQEASGGSNNWAIAAHRTATGRPILANDPHRLLLLPSLRYVSHLIAPGLNAIGAGEPSVPGLAIGHNETSAFGLTIHTVDQADLYVYELHADDAMLYRYGNGWERMIAAADAIPVRGQATVDTRHLFTRHGPVLFVDEVRQRAYGLRSVWSEAGSAPYVSALRYLRADSWDAFVEARSHWNTPPVNHVYADTSGDIGWIVSGLVPGRPGWDGLLPVEGDGRYEWQGFMPKDLHPRKLNPGSGWIATANEMNLPPDFDLSTYKIGFEWCDPCRYEAIAQCLSQDDHHDIAASCHLQTSYWSVTATRLIEVLKLASFDNVAAERARSLLAEWNCKLDAGTSAALLFEVWFRKHLIEAVSEALAPGAYAHFNAHDIMHLDTAQVTDLVVAPDKRFGSDPLATRDLILSTTLERSWLETCDLAGDDPGGWQWGLFHHAKFEHPLATLLGDETLNTHRVPKGGSGLTANAADYRPSDFRTTFGASFRMVLDVGEWDNSLFLNAPGQSGDPESRHYRDHFEPWSKDAYFPLLYSREQIEAATSQRIVLIPDPYPHKEAEQI